MSHSTKITIQTSNSIELSIIAGSREIASYANVDVGNALVMKGEEAANFLHRPRFMSFFPRKHQDLIKSTFAIEQEYEDEIAPQRPMVSSRDYICDHKPYEHFSLIIEHFD